MLLLLIHLGKRSIAVSVQQHQLLTLHQLLKGFKHKHAMVSCSTIVYKDPRILCSSTFCYFFGLYLIFKYNVFEYCFILDAKRSRFYVFCKSVCNQVKPGKLRVRCQLCKDEAFEINKVTKYHEI